MLPEPNLDISEVRRVPNPVPAAQIPMKRGIVTELTEKEIRWMYKENIKAQWQPFQGILDKLSKLQTNCKVSNSIFSVRFFDNRSSLAKKFSLPNRFGAYE